jgi:hypothetical protein
MRRPARRWVLALAVAVLPLTGCGSQDGGSPPPGPGGSPSSSPTPTTPTTPGALPVVVRRGGGIAGVRDSVTVQPDGSWRRAGRTGVPRTGTLSADQLDRLTRMAADPALPGEAGRPLPGIECADAFQYQVTAGGTTVTWQDCGSATEPPAVAAGIATFLLSTTS